MSVRKTCISKGCKYGDHRCDHTWESRLSINGPRRSVSIDDFVATRGGRAHIKEKREAEKIERDEIEPEWRAGRDPRQPPAKPVEDAHALLIAMKGYMLWELKKLAKAGHPAARNQMRNIVLYFGADRPVGDLARLDIVSPFKEDLAKGWRPARRRLKQEPEGNDLGLGHGKEQGWSTTGRNVVAVNRTLQRLRHFLHWCQHQTPPLLTSDPFHEFGVTINESDEEPHTRRLHDGELTALLQACREFNNAQHQFAGAGIERRILGAYWLGARGSELDRVQIAHIDYKAWIVTLTKGKSKASRPIWVDEDATELREILKKRRFLGADGYPFGDDDGAPYEDRTAWEAVAIRAHEIRTRQTVGTVMETGLQFRVLRRECASRWWEQMVDKDIVKLSRWLGHSSWKVTQRYLGLSDAELADNGMQRTLSRRKVDPSGSGLGAAGESGQG
jgi:integrase